VKTSTPVGRSCVTYLDLAPSDVRGQFKAIVNLLEITLAPLKKVVASQPAIVLFTTGTSVGTQRDFGPSTPHLPRWTLAVGVSIEKPIVPPSVATLTPQPQSNTSLAGEH
jgi:hypothetical protein